MGGTGLPHGWKQNLIGGARLPLGWDRATSWVGQGYLVGGTGLPHG